MRKERIVDRCDWISQPSALSLVRGQIGHSLNVFGACLRSADWQKNFLETDAAFGVHAANGLTIDFKRRTAIFAQKYRS
jgi:hypothetical protein